jgi:hypothetical protein
MPHFDDIGDMQVAKQVSSAEHDANDSTHRAVCSHLTAENIFFCRSTLGERELNKRDFIR